MTIWLDEKESRAFELIIESDLSDIVSLVADAGYDPGTFFVAGIADGLDFRGSDVTGISFHMASLNEAVFYKDQFEKVKQTKPRSCKRVKLFDRPTTDDPGPDHSGLSYPASSPRFDDNEGDSDTALSRFRSEFDTLKYVLGYAREFSEEDKRMLTELVLSMPDLEARLHALEYARNYSFLKKEIIEDLSTESDLNELTRISNQNTELSQTADRIYLEVSDKLRQNVEILKKYIINDEITDRIILNLLGDKVHSESELLYLKELYGEISCINFLEIVFSTSYFRSGKIYDIKHLFDILKKCNLEEYIGASELDLIAKHVRFNILQEFIDLCRDMKVEPSCRAFSSCAGHLPLEDAPKLARFMRREGVGCEKEVLNNLVPRCDNLVEIKNILELFNFRIENIIASKFRKLCPDVVKSVKSGSGFDDIEPFFQFCRDHKIKLDKPIMNFISFACINIDQVDKVLNLMKDAGIKPDSEMFVNFARAWSDVSSLPALLARAHQQGVITREHQETVYDSGSFYGFLISKAETLEKKRELLDEMDNLKIKHKFEWEIYLHIMNATEDFEKKFSVLREMKNKSVNPNIENFISLSDSVESIEDAVAVINLMGDFRVSPSSLIFENLSKTATGQKNLEVMLELMKRHDITVNKSIRQNLIAAVQDVTEKREVELLLKRYS